MNSAQYTNDIRLHCHIYFFFSSRRRHTRLQGDWSSDVCSSDLLTIDTLGTHLTGRGHKVAVLAVDPSSARTGGSILGDKTRMARLAIDDDAFVDRKSVM